jgi:hypothetical protein
MMKSQTNSNSWPDPAVEIAAACAKICGVDVRLKPLAKVSLTVGRAAPPAGTSAERPERFSVVTCAGVRFDDEYVVVRLPTGGSTRSTPISAARKSSTILRLSGPADGEREVLAPPLAPTSCEPTPTLVNDRKTTAESRTTVDSARPVASPDSGSSSDALTVPGKASREWRRPGSNRQPPACKAGALPIELRPRRVIPAVVFTLDGE